MSQTIAALFLSAVPMNPPYTFGNVEVGPGSYSRHDDGLGVGYEQAGMNSLAGSPSTGAVWRLRYRFLAPIPAGTLKVVLVALCDENNVDAKVQIKWASVPMGSSPSETPLNDEGVSTLSWGNDDHNKYMELKVTLDAAVPTDGSMLVLDLGFIYTVQYLWTITKTSTWLLPMIVAEQ